MSKETHALCTLKAELIAMRRRARIELARCLAAFAQAHEALEEAEAQLRIYRRLLCSLDTVRVSTASQEREQSWPPQQGA